LRTLFKNIIREFFAAPGRFIALLLIVILGAAFFTGLRSTAPSMRLTADEYFERTQLSDFRIMSPLGLTESDILALREHPDVDAVMPLHTADALLKRNNVLAIYAVRSLPKDSSESNPDYLNRVTLSEGRMPQNENECLADKEDLLSIGDVVQVADENNQETLDRFAQRTFTVVGIATTPVYISVERGNTTIGTGTISAFLYVPESAFDSAYYSEADVRLKSTTNLSAFSKDYGEIIQTQSEALTTFGAPRAQIRYDEEKKRLDDAQNDYDAAQAEAHQKLSDAQMQVNQGQVAIDLGETEYTSETRKLNAAAAAIAKARTEITAKRYEIDSLRIKLTQGKAAADLTRKELITAKSDLQTLNTNLNTARSGLAVLNAQIAAGRTGFANMQAQMNALMLDPLTNATAIASLQAQMDALAKQISDAETQAATLQSQIATGEAQAKAAVTAIAEGEAQLAEADKMLLEGEAQIQDGDQRLLQAESETKAAELQLLASIPLLKGAREKLNEERAKLTDGRTAYEQNKEDAESELANAKNELETARQTFEKIETPRWYVFSREDNPGYSGFSSDADRVGSLSTAITLFLYVVAALVCLSTMTRMVEEQRMQIGTLKALGYSNRVIQFKYFFYASFLGVVGGAIGVIAGLLAFPSVIWDVYATLYAMGDMHLAITPLPCIIGLLVGPIAMVLATAIACGSELKSSAAELLRPKAPKAGKRVWLEHVGILWRHLSFSNKVTLRNLFRYKKRFITTIVGVAGCCALLLAGSGLRDSVGGILGLQYGTIHHSSITVYLDEGFSSAKKSSLNEKLSRYGDYLYFHGIDTNVEKGTLDNKNMQTSLFVPENSTELNNFISFRERASGHPIKFPPTVTDTPSVVITEKLAKALGVSPGDTIDIAPTNQTKQKVQVAALTENYIYNYVYLTPESYTQLFGKEPEFKAVLLMPDKTDDASLQQILTDLISTDHVKSATSILQAKSIMSDIASSMNSIIWIIIGVAGCLAMVVLYNLTNINIIERNRELATLKVLGFHRKEISSYVNHESFILCLIGIAFGLVGGVLLHRYVVTAIEVDEFMFGRIIKPISFVTAGLFTLLCNIIIHFAMKPRLRKINPVASLKSAE
jgi:putative ABC transport system permease protein